MPRSKPSAKIDIIGNLDIPPEKATGDYVESLQQRKYFINPPNWDSPSESIEILLIKNQREQATMLNLQLEMKEKTKLEAEKYQKRLIEFYKIQIKLRKRIIGVNDFIKNCENKKKNVKKKIIEENVKQKNLHQSINETKHEIEELEEFRNELTKTITELLPYEQIINEVVTKSDIYDSIKDCIDRCDALALARAEIAELMSQKLLEIDEMHLNMAKVANDAALIVIGLKNKLAALQRTYKEACVQSLKWEQVLSDAKDCFADYEVNRDRTLDGIQHMYRLLCKRRNKEAIYQRHEVEKQLDFIAAEIELLEKLIEEANGQN